jgi:hypothetical protein
MKEWLPRVLFLILPFYLFLIVFNLDRQGPFQRVCTADIPTSYCSPSIFLNPIFIFILLIFFVPFFLYRSHPKPALILGVLMLLLLLFLTYFFFAIVFGRI